jgi:hypothetical protein
MKSPLLLLFLLSTLILTGCATGPGFQEYSAKLPAPAPDEGRVWFYRPSKMFGSAVQPHVHLNGQIVGKSQPGCYFFTDRPPGDYEVMCSTEWASKTTFHLSAGDEKFIRLTMGPGVWVGHVIPEEVNRDKGLREIAGCKLITADGANADLKEK